tara:strand:+ start:68 stop:274 length:207 start_codon:yes stop_codon:yes gene_type:complete
MTIQEIKQAILEGLIVHWSNDSYQVQTSGAKDNILNYNIVCLTNNSCTGLTWLDGVTLNGNEQDFYIK